MPPGTWGGNVGRVARDYIGSWTFAGPDFVLPRTRWATPSGRAILTATWRRCVRERRLQVMPADRTQVVEDTDAERDDGRNRKIDAQLVAEIDQPGRQGHVGQQTTEENTGLERARD